MSRTLFALQLALLAALAHSAAAQGTHLWNQSRFDEFEKGRSEGVAIHSDGSLTPGPKLTEISTTPSTYVWSLAADARGNAYLATGSPATVLRISPDGKSTRLFDTKDLSVQAIAIGPDGAVYAATLPSGKVYRFKPDGAAVDDGTATVVFDPGATSEKPKYIWDLLFDSQNRLYIATGAPAAIYRVEPEHIGAKPELFFKSDEQHIRCMTFDPDGNLIAGSDGGGLVYRIGKDGKGFVIYDAPKREITSVAAGANGVIYAAAVGEKNRNTLPPLPVTGTATVTATITIVQPGSVQASNANGLVPDGSDVYELNASGAPRKLWSDKEDVVYALEPSPQGLLAATGNRGRIYRIQESGEYEDIAHVDASQAMGFAETAGGLFIGSSNTGKLFSLSSAPDANATYSSDVFDAAVFSQWGRVEANPASGPYDLFARAGNLENPERNWSDWKKIDPANETLGLPSARFVQWKAVLHANASLSSVGLNYLPVNVAPVVDEVVVQPGARVNPAAVQQQQPQPITINFPSAQSNALSFQENAATAPLPGFKDKNSVTVRWAAHDDNGDELTFSVYFRGAGDSTWRLLRENLNERYYSFDSALLPDGAYRIKLVASDAPSHNPGEALTADRVSDRFIIDTAPPVITGLTARLDQGRIHVTATATDSASPVSRAEYSVDAGPWQYVEPVGKLSDSPEEHYDFSAPIPPPPGSHPGTPATPVGGEHIVTLRAYDRYDNVATSKTNAR